VVKSAPSRVAAMATEKNDAIVRVRVLIEDRASRARTLFALLYGRGRPVIPERFRKAY
jgi:hypothetical protein